MLSDGPDSFMPGAAVRTRTTPDDDPARVYHNIAVAIDPARQLFNGQPGTLGVWLDTLEIAPGMRVLHVGAGLGYYTAVMAQCVGNRGRVVAYELDDALAQAARCNLSPYRNVGAASRRRIGPARWGVRRASDQRRRDAPARLVARRDGARRTVDAADYRSHARDGRHARQRRRVIVSGGTEGEFAVRVLTVVAVYSADGVRDPAMNGAIGAALMAGPARWQGVNRLRRDAHEPAASCWLHRDSCCFSAM